MNSPNLVIVLRIGAAHQALKKPWTEESVLELAEHMGLKGSRAPALLQMTRAITGKTNVSDLDHSELGQLAKSLIGSAKKKMGGGCG